MSGYGPPSAESLGVVGGAVLATLVLGVLLLRARPGAWMRGLVWAHAGAALVLAPLLTRGERAGTRMLVVSAAILLAMKVVVTAEARLDGRPAPGVYRWLGFVFLWPGMRPWTFAESRPSTRRGALSFVLGGGGRVLLGLLVLASARAVPDGNRPPAVVAVVVLLLLGLGLVVHLGLFRVLVGAWRSAGVPVPLLFDAPERSRSLAEFWSRRWNLSFSEMMQIAVHRPLRRRVGPHVATAAVFLFSGLLHELAISVPARGGYGLPSLYFALQGALLLREPPGGWGRAVTLAIVLLPLPLVFHPWLLAACVVPLAG